MIIELHPGGDKLAIRRRKQDWWTPPKSGNPFTFVDFARTEGRFAKQFERNGNPSDRLVNAQQDRLHNWRILQELARLR